MRFIPFLVLRQARHWREALLGSQAKGELPMEGNRPTFWARVGMFILSSNGPTMIAYADLSV